ncbi:uncharacterized protein LOC116247764 [Nymphaea colorata]|nr:uncharacterized protein LOC116247764 [Nymphaea colorata]
MEEEEVERFFDSREEMASASDSGSEYGEGCELGSSGSFLHDVERSGLEVWTQRPDSVRERRERFMRRMGLDLAHGEEAGCSGDGSEAVIVARANNGGAAQLGNLDSGSELSAGRSSRSSWLEDSSSQGDEDGIREAKECGRGDSMCRIKNLDDGSEFLVDDADPTGDLGRIRQLGSDQLVSIDEFHKYLGYSPIVQSLMRRDAIEAFEGDNGRSNPGSDTDDTESTRRKGWLESFKAVISRRHGRSRSMSSDLQCTDAHCENLEVGRLQRVKVHHGKKSFKEFSSVCRTQEIQAHAGLIFTMKFSRDGKYLASAGEDGVVRVWQVVESERTSELDIFSSDSSCVYFTLDRSGELTPIDKDKGGKSNKKNLSTACAIIPPRIFRLSEKPIHEFQGHTSGVLDLSWSQSKCLLSSSMDKTVRLWQLGSEKCVKVFPHNNYVTSVQFNPADEIYFISGSIDGKIRIWSTSSGQVVDWTDVRDIVTAVSYSPDGQAAVIGSLTGNCRFYDASDHQLQLENEICLQGKKKSPGKRITGFQFLPDAPQKVMVTSADSQIRIIDKHNIVSKYKGFRNTSSQISASFTLSGRHIICASEDSHVCIWNNVSQEPPRSKTVKSNRTCERFFSSKVSVAIPWCRPKNTDPVSISAGIFESHCRSSSDSLTSFENGGKSYWDSCESSPISSSSSPGGFSMGHGFFADGLLRGSSATWPEEKLPLSSTAVVGSNMCKYQYKCLKTACINSAAAPYAWDMVIVTASWDGRIRAYHNFGLPTRN